MLSDEVNKMELLSRLMAALKHGAAQLEIQNGPDYKAVKHGQGGVFNLRMIA